jgi:RNA polymerase sigma factor (TIGR02999 family)
MHERPDITQLLRELSEGRRDAFDRLMPMVYDELRRLAHQQLRGERTGHTLNTTALVHEAYLRLLTVEQMQWVNRAHFFGAAARAMRRVLIDYARARGREKRGGDAIRVSLAEAIDERTAPEEDLLDVDAALSRLEAMSERQCRVVECRCFGGLSVEETAVAVGVSVATVKRDWSFARAWLNRELGSMGA